MSFYYRLSFLWLLLEKEKKTKTHKIKPKLNRMMFLWRCELVGSDVGLFRILNSILKIGDKTWTSEKSKYEKYFRFTMD